MKGVDFIPLAALVLLLTCLVIITVLAVLHLDIPSTVGVVAAASLAALFTSSAQRGTSPPNDKGGV